uniref:Reverse transcriptase domain-containing protein n=1 Tax=Tanacetum cinerariifolium TaxID=118510 RepID=A0A6L2P9R8_TANCI|nr:reverse transcriptase domain-containing protein [Tanacetum cinerariifolium]
MSSPNHPTFDIEDAFSSNSPNYILASPGYFQPHRETLLLILPMIYLKFFLPEEILPPKKRGRIRSSSSTFALPQAFKMGESSHKTSLKRYEKQIKEILNHLDELSLDHIEEIEGNPSSSPVIYGESFGTHFMSSRTAREDHHHQATRLDPMAPKRTLTSLAPTMNQTAIWQLIDDRIAAALEAQAANMANTDNTNRTFGPRETHVAKKCTYKEFMSSQPFYFNGTEGAVGLIRWFERTESVFSRSNCTEDCKVKFAIGTLIEDALSWWNSYAKPIGIEQADKIAWSEFKRLLTNKYCPRTEVKKMEDEFYNLVVKGNDLKTYDRRFQELAVLCPNMVPNTEKLMEVFIGGLPRSIEGSVTASKPQTLKKAINITQRLMDQVTKHNSVQGTNDHRRKFDDSRNTNNNNYQDNHNNYNRNNDYHQQQNRRQETVRTYAATLTENKREFFWLYSIMQRNLHH